MPEKTAQVMEIFFKKIEHDRESELELEDLCDLEGTNHYLQRISGKAWNSLLLSIAVDNEDNQKLIKNIKKLSADDAKKTFLELVSCVKKLSSESNEINDTNKESNKETKNFYDIKNIDVLVSCCALEGFERTLKLLLDSGADANACNSDGVNLLGAAACKGNAASIRLLIEANADLTCMAGNQTIQSAFYCVKAKRARKIIATIYFCNASARVA